MKKTWVLMVVLTLVLSCTSCGQKLDFNDEDRKFITNNGYSSTIEMKAAPTCLDTCLGFATAVFVGSVKDIEHVELFSSDGGDDPVVEYNLFTVQVDDLWFGEVVGGEVVLDSSTIYYNDDIFINHRDCQYVFILSAAPLDNPFDERLYMAIDGFYSIIPIQSSTGKMYPLYTSLPEYQQLEGKSPEYLKELISTEQQNILENGYDDSGDRLSVNFLGDVLSPYQTAYETGEAVYLEPPVITKLKKEALSQYKDEPYYEELLKLATEEYRSRKNKRGLSELDLLETLEKMLPKLAEKAEEMKLQIEK